MEGPNQRQGSLRWTKEECDAIVRAFETKRDVKCPVCQRALEVVEVPGPKIGTSYFTFVCRACQLGARAAFLRWDPNVFVYPPFHHCPKCGKAEFGVSQILGDGHSRRCRACAHVVWRRLPRPKKSVIYLDQHVISNMMLALNPAVERERAARAAFGRELFEVLDRAVKLQVVICPDSHIHQRESQVSVHFEALRRMYEQLSCGITFEDEFDIEMAQVKEHALNWLRGEPAMPSRLQAQDVVHGDLDGWHDHLRIDVRHVPELDAIARLRARRDSIHLSLPAAFRRWASGPKPAFSTFRAEKVASFSHGLRTSYEEYWARRGAIEADLMEPGEDDLFPPHAVTLVHEVALAIQMDGGLTEERAGAAMWKYFDTADHARIPFVQLDALLCAALAWQFVHNRTKLGRGTVNDLAAITHLLPYCDAMYLDNEMYRLLTEPQVARELGYGTQLFSSKTRNEFVAYVKGLIAAAPPEHMARVRDVYGEKCGEPFVTMYEGG